MKKFLLVLGLIFCVHSVHAETVVEFYQRIYKNQSSATTYINGVYYGVLYEKYKNPDEVEAKYQSCQKKFSTIDLILGYKLLYVEKKIDQDANAMSVIYQIIKENCLLKE